jgi:hypothetical protein
MWPWEHLAFGYVLYAIYIRLRGLLAPGDSYVPPSDRVAVGLAVGTQFPDLVDKPLAWVFGLLPSGVSLAHSVFVALPVVILLTVSDRWWGLDGVGIAFGMGYLSHLAGDLLYPLAVEGGISITYLMWPVVPKSSDLGPFIDDVELFWAAFVQFLATPRGQLYLLFELVFLAVALALWLWDGTPGVRWLDGR